MEADLDADLEADLEPDRDPIPECAGWAGEVEKDESLEEGSVEMRMGACCLIRRRPDGPGPASSRREGLEKRKKTVSPRTHQGHSARTRRR